MTMAFQCHHPGCSRSYKRREHLLRHQKAHANLRPFACQVCLAAFNRSDLLNRHIVKSHSTSQGNLGPSRSASFLKHEPKRGIGNSVEGDGDAKPDRECRQLALRRLGDSMLITLGAELAQASNRRLLEQLYFRELHPHWPILHQKTFQSKTQPEELVQAVLFAGLWMTNTAKTKQLAECHHDRMVEIQCKNSSKLDQQSNLFNAPRPEFLALFQTLMITAILLTYRGANGFPSTVVDNKRLLRLTIYNKRLFRLFDRAGVFDQQRIDAENPLNPIVREQYQRLALILFKAFVHLNALLITHLPKFRLFDYFDPAMLNVRAPSSQRMWDAGNKDYLQNVNDRTLIGGLFTGDANDLTYQALTSIAAWDFSTGMILGCFFKRQLGEPLLELMPRVTPFLFWDLNIQARKESGV